MNKLMQKLLVLLVGATGSAFGMKVHVFNQSDWEIQPLMTTNNDKVVDKIAKIKPGQGRYLTNFNAIKTLTFQGMGSMRNSSLFNVQDILAAVANTDVYKSKSKDFVLSIIILKVGDMLTPENWNVSYRFEDTKHKPNLIIENADTSDDKIVITWKNKEKSTLEKQQTVEKSAKYDLGNADAITSLTIEALDYTQELYDAMNSFAKRSEAERVANNILIKIEQINNEVSIVKKPMALIAKSIPVIRPHNVPGQQEAPVLPNLTRGSKVQELAIANNSGVKILLAYKVNGERQIETLEPATNKIISLANTISDLTFEAEGFVKYNAEDLLNLAKNNLEPGKTQRTLLRITRAGKTTTGWIIYSKIFNYGPQIKTLNLSMKHGGRIKQK